MGLQKNLFLGGQHVVWSEDLLGWDRLYMMYPGHYKQNPATFKRWFGLVKDTNVFWPTEDVVMGQKPMMHIDAQHLWGMNIHMYQSLEGDIILIPEWNDPHFAIYSDLLGTWCRIATWGTRPGKLTVCYGKSQFFMGKSTISMAIFNSKLLVYQAGYVPGIWRIFRLYPTMIKSQLGWIPSDSLPIKGRTAQRRQFTKRLSTPMNCWRLGVRGFHPTSNQPIRCWKVCLENGVETTKMKEYGNMGRQHQY